MLFIKLIICSVKILLIQYNSKYKKIYFTFEHIEYRIYLIKYSFIYYFLNFLYYFLGKTYQ